MFPIRDHNPSGSRPLVTWALMAINIAVFLWMTLTFPEGRALDRFYFDWGLVPIRTLMGETPETLITSMFLHGGWMHLAGNMLFLWVFGDNVEDQMGKLRFLGFYLAAGLGAAAFQIGSEPGSYIPMIGASGAIAGVLGAYLLLFPAAKVDILIIFIIFFRIFPIPAWIVLGIWFGLQLFNGFSTAGDGVAYWAHAGGFLAGAGLALPLWLRRGGIGFWRRTHGEPPHPPAEYPAVSSSIPRVPRRK